MTDDDILSTLPDVLRRVADECGLGAALALAREYGGREIYVPDRLGADHELARAIGLAAARVLQKHYGKGRLLIPLGPAAHDRGVRARINKLLAEGQSAPAINKATGRHIRTIYRHKGKRRTRGAEPDLFNLSKYK